MEPNHMLITDVKLEMHFVSSLVITRTFPCGSNYTNTSIAYFRLIKSKISLQSGSVLASLPICGQEVYHIESVRWLYLFQDSFVQGTVTDSYFEQNIIPYILKHLQFMSTIMIDNNTLEMPSHIFWYRSFQAPKQHKRVWSIYQKYVIYVLNNRSSYW